MSWFGWGIAVSLGLVNGGLYVWLMAKHRKLDGEICRYNALCAMFGHTPVEAHHTMTHFIGAGDTLSIRRQSGEELVVIESTAATQLTVHLK